MNSNVKARHGSQKRAEASKALSAREAAIQDELQCEKLRHIISCSASLWDRGKGAVIFESQCVQSAFQGALQSSFPSYNKICYYANFEDITQIEVIYQRQFSLKAGEKGFNLKATSFTMFQELGS